jgi:hypothetical protein
MFYTGKARPGNGDWAYTWDLACMPCRGSDLRRAHLVMSVVGVFDRQYPLRVSSHHQVGDGSAAIAPR